MHVKTCLELKFKVQIALKVSFKFRSLKLNLQFRKIILNDFILKQEEMRVETKYLYIFYDTSKLDWSIYRMQQVKRVALLLMKGIKTILKIVAVMTARY